MELNGWSSPQMLQRYGGSARGVRARRHYDLIMGLTSDPISRPGSRREQPGWILASVAMSGVPATLA
jgi:hypothetical protein